MADGWDPRDPFSVPSAPVDWSRATAGDLTGLRIAYSSDFGGYPVDHRVTAVIDDAVQAFADGGADNEPIDLRLPCTPQEHCDIWLRQTASSNLDLLGLCCRRLKRVRKTNRLGKPTAGTTIQGLASPRRWMCKLPCFRSIRSASRHPSRRKAGDR